MATTKTAQATLTQQLTAAGVASPASLAKSLIAADKKAGGDGSVSSIREGIATGESWITAAANNYSMANTSDIAKIGERVTYEKAQNKANTIASNLDKAFDALSGRDMKVSINMSQKANGNLVYAGGTGTHQSQWAGQISISAEPTTSVVTVPVYQDVTTTEQVTTYVPVTRTGTQTVTDVSYQNVTSYSTVYDTVYSQNRSSDISNSMIPYMRSIPILISATGLKPSTLFNAYFDNKSVNSNITPAVVLETTPITGYSYEFDTTTNVGAPTTPRQITNSPVNTLLTGDIITGQTSNATAVLVGTELNSSIVNRKFFIVNVKGTFQANEVVIGSISGARATISTITTPSTLTSSIYGNLFGIFTIPNSGDKVITTGQKTFLLTESDNVSADSDSYAKVDFVASGTLRTEQQIVTTVASQVARQVASTTSVRVETPREVSYTYQDTQAVTNNVTTTQSVIVGTTQQTVTNNDGVSTIADVKVVSHAPTEPLAQTFFVAEPTGICLTGIDLFFASKDSTLPVKMCIINVEKGGQPGMMEVPLSTVVMPADKVNVSSASVVSTVDGKTYAAPTVATRFNFASPIYLNGNTSYAIFISSDSFKYNVWTSYMNDATVNGMGVVAKQPQLGTLFKSQNAVSWSTDQFQDLCFKMYRAKFTPDVNVTVPFKNVPLPSKLLTKALRVTAGSNKIRVIYRNHGMQDGHKFTLSGVSTTYFGVPASEYNSTFIISNTEIDSFVITLPTTTPTSSGVIDEDAIYGSKNVRYEQIRPMINDLVLPNTSISYQYKGVKSTNAKQSGYTGIKNYQPTDTGETLFALSDINQTYYNATAGTTSIDLQATMSTSSEYTTPFIDSHRVSVITTGNKINTPSITMNVAGIDYINLSLNWAANTYVDIDSLVYSGGNKYIVTASGKLGSSAPVHVTGSATNGTATLLYIGSSALITVDATNNYLASSNSYVQSTFKNVFVGTYVTVSGCNTAGNNGTFMVTKVASDGSYLELNTDLTAETSTTIVVQSGVRYKDEITPYGSSSISDYVTKELRFANLSTAFRTMFTYNMPVGCGIDIYYKISNSFDSTIHSSQSYTKLVPDVTLLTSENKSVLYNATLHVENLTAFDTLSMKIVYTSSDTNKFPRMRNLRIIALA